MHKIKEKLTEELKMLEKQIEKKDTLSPGDLELIHKLTDTIKNIDKICMLEEEENEYSEKSYWMGDGRMYGQSYDGGQSYARGRGRNAKRDSMGRYSSEGSSYDDGMSYAREGRGGSGGQRGYSREVGMSYDNGKEYMVEKIEELMADADPKSREALKRAVKQIENA